MNGDGHLDVLSGSYSHMAQPMAGLFQVLWGSEDGFQVAEALTGIDDEPLIIESTNFVDSISTRPFAADIDADGDLDLVVGTFAGSFYLFKGENGSFQQKATKIKAGTRTLNAGAHSDPFLVDWDSDGDLDLLSGNSYGRVAISINSGTAQEADFGKFQTLIKGPKVSRETVFGDKHINRPMASSRIWVEDFNGDGKLDILVGDSLTITHPADGLEEDEALEKMQEWDAELAELMKKYQPLMMQSAKSATQSNMQESEEESHSKLSQEDQMQEYQETINKHYEARQEILREDRTGYVWVYYQK